MQVNWRDVLLALSCLSGLGLWGLFFLIILANVVGGRRGPPFPPGRE